MALKLKKWMETDMSGAFLGVTQAKLFWRCYRNCLLWLRKWRCKAEWEELQIQTSWKPERCYRHVQSNSEQNFSWWKPFFTKKVTGKYFMQGVRPDKCRKSECCSNLHILHFNVRSHYILNLMNCVPSMIWKSQISDRNLALWRHRMCHPGYKCVMYTWPWQAWYNDILIYLYSNKY